MGLVATVPAVDRGARPSAEDLDSLTVALDEILQRRFNRRTWLAFAGGTLPELPLGTQFLFGTASNLLTSATPYDFAWETPPVPVGGLVVSHNETTKVVWVTGYTVRRTLNRQHVLWTPPGVGSVEADYWFGFYRPERWEPLALADILVENYLESHEVSEPSNAVFNLRTTWDRFGCVRIHNGNRFPLLVFNLHDAGADEWTIPPYGILTGRRDSPTGRWTMDRYYLPRTHTGDEMRYNAPAPGQFAASLELSEWLVGQIGQNTWARVRPCVGTDSGDVDAPFYAGHLPLNSDKFVDWMLHRGTLLSVVLDKRDGAVTITPLTWRGIGSIPDATWAGHVTVAIVGASLTLTSAVTPPAGAGPTEWEHDLIPVSSNVTQGSIIPLRPGPYAIYLSPVAPPLLSAPISLGAMQEVGSGSAYPSRDDLVVGETILFTYSVHGPGDPVSSWGGWTEQVGVTLPDVPPATGYDRVTTALIKGLGGLVKTAVTQVDLVDGWGVASFTEGLLVRLVGPPTLSWLQAEGRSYSGSRRGWVARVPRRHMTGGAILGGVAVHDNHPWDTETLGTPDGLGLELGWTPGTIEASGIQIEGAISAFPEWPMSTALGRPVYLPQDSLDYILENITTPNWWKNNRAIVLAGVPPAAQLRSMRLPRTAEEFNDLAQVIAGVQWVRRVDIRDLHKDPLVAYAEYPFNFEGESPFAVPLGWAWGRYDTDNALGIWCALWGITPQTTLPGLADLRGVDRNRWARLWELRPSGGSNPMPWGQVTWKFLLTPFSDFSAETIDTVNGYGFSSLKAFRAAESRLLFGGAGADTDYLWVSATALHAVFDPLGIDSPPPPVGEFYEPKISDPADDPPIIEGAIFGAAETGRSDIGDAQQAYRDTDIGDGTNAWVAVLPEFGAFRLVTPTGTASVRFGTSTEMTDHTTTDPDDPDTELLTNQVMVWEVDEGANVPLLGYYSARGSPPLNAPGSAGGVPIWQEVASFVAPFDILVVGTGMPAYFAEWDDHAYPGHRSTSDSTRWQEPHFHTAPGIDGPGQLFITADPEAYEMRSAMAPAGTTVDPAWLQSQGWPVSTAYHVQWMRISNQNVSGFLNDA